MLLESPDRQQSGDPRWERILTAFAQGEFRKRIAGAYGIILYIPGRINDGGCKQEPHDTREWTAPWSHSDIIEASFCSCRTDLRDDGHIEFLNDLAKKLLDIFPRIDVHEYTVNEAANCGIMARILNL